MGRLGDLLGRLDAALGVLGRSFGDSEPSWTVLGASLGPLGALRGAWKAAPRRKTISESQLPGGRRAAGGVLFAGGPPGAAPRARTRIIVNQLPEILARLWPVGPANFAKGRSRERALTVAALEMGTFDVGVSCPLLRLYLHSSSRCFVPCLFLLPSPPAEPPRIFIPNMTLLFGLKY